MKYAVKKDKLRQKNMRSKKMTKLSTILKWLFFLYAISIF